MSSEDLFGSYTKSRSNFKSIAIGAAALVVLVSLGVGIVWFLKPVPPSVDEVLAREIRDNTVMLLDFQTYSGEEFREQILGKGRLLRYVKVNDEAFFIHPAVDEQELSDFLSRCFYDRAKIEFGGPDGYGNMKVGDYKVPESDETRHFFRTSLANIRIDAKKVLNFPYQTASYTLSLEEMNNFLNDSTLYGGKLIARTGARTDRPVTIFANHGIMVARPGEPSLERLAADLLKDVGPEREARVQRLVDFVSTEIAYNYIEGFGQRETLKRASETLMTRNGDCSNKTILLASLLEQIGEEYIILYCPQHITIAVPQGNFSLQNKLDFAWSDRNWVIAETTLSGFQVGTTVVADAARLQTVNYVQEPKHMQVIFDTNSFEPLNFF
jgi:hypothetical protein